MAMAAQTSAAKPSAITSKAHEGGADHANTLTEGVIK
jgi:hypothetical protein